MSEMNLYLADVGRLLWRELIAGLASYGSVVCCVSAQVEQAHSSSYESHEDKK